MINSLINVSFDSMNEKKYLNDILDSINEKPSSTLSNPLIYDEHRVLLVAAYIAKDFLNEIDSSEDNELINYYSHLEYWYTTIEDNIITPHTSGYLGTPNPTLLPSDYYLFELYNTIKFVGFKSPHEYPLIVFIDENPYIPYWYVLKWGYKALNTYIPKNLFT